MRARNRNLTISLGTSMADAECLLIQATLQHFNNQKERAVAPLGISLKTLYNRLKDYAADKSDGDFGVSEELCHLASYIRFGSNITMP